MILRSIRGRLLVLAAVWITVALLAAFLVIGAVLDRFIAERYDADLQAVSDQVMAGLSVGADGRVTVDPPPADPRFSAPLGGWYWQVRADRVVVAKSASLGDAQLRGPGRERHRGPMGGRGPMREPLRVMVQVLTLPGSDLPLELTVTAPAREIVGSIAAVRRPLALSLAVLGLGLGLAVAVQVGSGLSGLARLGADLRRVREGQAERLTRPGVAELDPLVAEINAALDQNATLLARSRQHLGNLAHSLKTPLAALANDLPPDHPGQTLVTRMDRLVGWHLRRARSAQPRVLGQRTAIRPVIDDILMVLRHPMEQKGIAATVNCNSDIHFPGERQDLEEIIGNLLDNAVKWGRSRIIVTAGAGPFIRIEDDGPGMADGDESRAILRGARLDESGPPGSGLGLAIVADLAALHGAELRIGRSEDLGGLLAELGFPDGRQ